MDANDGFSAVPNKLYCNENIVGVKFFLSLEDSMSGSIKSVMNKSLESHTANPPPCKKSTAHLSQESACEYCGLFKTITSKF